ncbi:hypothetical protein [Paenimyroides baculatum]|uniref:Guanylate cyclase domain-containing protein n=1 Tax=Paenimyroides baculatum TaxID=2608000 RepID=A0A5M6CT58_9FLAO|nr:hypothetical protein [Paenimyroides baculatum]KAA5538136.1 hypothetical protein F0460_00605 [Paenimyroides baculatum]
MNTFKEFKFERRKGIVWVCDVIKSSSYLNSNDTVEDIEEYLPRLYWTANNLVNSFGGKFIKWTGDVFLAWFDIDLDRNKKRIAEKVFKAAWHLTFLNNVTQLGVKPQTKFGVRHGITYEKDGLLFEIQEQGGHHSLDLIGRAVVLAFRLSGIQAKFPSIVTEKEIVSENSTYSKFDKWNPNESDILKFFKGETFGIEGIMISTEKAPENYSEKIEDSKKKLNKLIHEVDNNISIDEEIEECLFKFLELMKSGPHWCNDVVKLELEFNRKMLEALKETKRILKD